MSKLTTSQLLLLAKSSYLLLLAWVLLWHLWLSPPVDISLTMMLVFWVVPLLFPLKGILAGKPYTYAWSCFVLLLYVLHSTTLLVVSDTERWLAAVELILVLSAFWFGLQYAKFRGKELGIGLKKLKNKTKD
ncbi:DUF2069 domain-containing protein [Agarivorans aestuarii]|uniref:DUF2069 domain-containing protein n=1 Tax=Agarivorans aestuarii TaxID=1563703 RepID=A0ABU7G3W5_9ALTE|nr:DUF2069 domain-containing protein [Agarivorans aestuarii]MEE1674099.1 DUF2069 domain-containing protein [Agarivorans aestuarii]